MMFKRFTMLMVVSTIGVVSGLQWSEQLNADREPIQVCSGQNLQLFWNFTLDDGERLKGMVWGCLPEGKAEHVLATYVDDHFVPVSSFSGRLSHLKDGGIELSCATILESGNYSIAVTTEKDNVNTVHHKTASVTVVDTPKTPTGDFHVTQAPEAVRDVTTGSWHVLLLCGNYSDRGHPPVDVMWTTPKGEKLPSTSYEEGYFQLQVPNPVVGGTYTCSLFPPDQPACSCMPQDSPLRLPETQEILEISSRFLLLEAQQREILDKVKVVDDRRVKAVEELSNRTGELEKWRVESNQAPRPIAFHARTTRDILAEDDMDHFAFSSGSEQALILDKVITNQGEGYDSASGVFRAPLSGTYFFIGTTGPPQKYRSRPSNMRLKKGGETLAEIEVDMYNSNRNMGSCQATIYLNEGDRVWLEGSDNNVYASSVTSFSGFRIG